MGFSICCLLDVKQEGVGDNNRSMMPLDVLGRTRATLMRSASLFLCRAQLFTTWFVSADH